MASRSTPLFLSLLLLAGCSSSLGRVQITVVFENESRTQCLRVSARNEGGASVNASPAALRREGKDSLTIGLGETAELTGEVRVTVARFSTPDCAGTAFASETKPATLVTGQPTVNLEFRYGDDPGDGGTDGGIDGGSDAGCDLGACTNSPTECELPTATACLGSGGCLYQLRPMGTPCGTGGVCNSQGTCIADVCSVVAQGTPCEDGLACTNLSTCNGSGVCSGTCAGSTPDCNLPAQPVVCDPANPGRCVYRPASEFGGCGTEGGKCIDGGCMPWPAFTPLNFPSTVETCPYPTGSITLASPDDGGCDTVISTTGAAATVIQADCGSPVLTSTVDDAGVSVILTRGLDVGPAVRLHFVGDRPVQLVVLGDASIRGLVSVAPLLTGQSPAGTNSPLCSPAVAGDASKKGGGGGGFGSTGGNGGETGGSGGGATSATSPLRGGCSGAAGFRPTGTSPPGLGGGAIQLIVSGTLTLNGGTVSASGGGGTQGTADTEGGGGGGSGGTVILEAQVVDLTGGAVTANGGGGGQGGEDGVASAPGAPGLLSLATAAPAANGPSTAGAGGVGGVGSSLGGGNGGNGGGSSKGGGGGGGAAGVVYVRAATTCTRGTGIISGGHPSPISCP